MEKKRIIWLDQARAIGMFIVMIGHAISAGKFKKWIYSFHMPFFFMLSGMTFKNSHEKNFKDYLVDKIKKLVIPYIILNIIMISVYMINVNIGARKPVDVDQLFIGTLFSHSSVYPMVVVTTWFILCLFVIEVIFYALKRIFKEDSQLFIAVMVCGLIGYANSLSITNKMMTPWHISTALTGVVFYFIGYIFMKNVDAITAYVENNKKLIITVILLGVVGYFSSMVNRQISMNQEKYGSIIYFYIAAICNSLAFLLVVMRVPSFKLFKFVGQHTIVYLGMHSPIILMIKKLVPFFAENMLNSILLCGLLYFALIPVSMLVMQIPGMKSKRKPVQTPIPQT